MAMEIPKQQTVQLATLQHWSGRLVSDKYRQSASMISFNYMHNRTWQNLGPWLKVLLCFTLVGHIDGPPKDPRDLRL